MKSPSWVYMMSNTSRTLYVGVTSDLEGRVAKHKSKTGKGYTQKYNCTILVWCEEHGSIDDAIARERYLKGKSWAFKLQMI